MAEYVEQCNVNPNTETTEPPEDKSKMASEINNPNNSDSQNLFRLMQLFPWCQPVTLQKIYERCEKNFVRTIDNILYFKRYAYFLNKIRKDKLLTRIPSKSETKSKNVNQFKKPENVKKSKNIVDETANSSAFNYSMDLSTGPEIPENMQSCSYGNSKDMFLNESDLYIPNGSMDGIQFQIQTDLYDNFSVIDNSFFLAQQATEFFMNYDKNFATSNAVGNLLNDNLNLM